MSLMAFEKFNPVDPKYKTTTDLPEKLQGNFRDVSGGFVRKEVVRYEEGLGARAEEVSRWGQRGESVTVDELREQDAVITDQKIAEEVRQRVERLEASIGVPLSEEARQEIYGAAARETYLSPQEIYDQHYEQGQFLNIQIEEISREIVALSEEQLRALPPEKKRAMLAQLGEFDRFVPDAKRTETLDSASQRLLEGYQPSGELKQLHREAHGAVMEGFEQKELLEFRYNWGSYSQERKLSLCQKVADLLAVAYRLDRAPKVIISTQQPEDMRETTAAFVESAEGGIVFVYRPEVMLSSFAEMASNMSHEMAHAHQKKLTNQRGEGEASNGAFREDASWFQLDEKLEQTYGKEFYQNNYYSITKEQDAFGAQEDFKAFFDSQMDLVIKKWDTLLMASGLSSAREMGNRSSVIIEAQEALQTKQPQNGDELIKILEDDFLVFPQDSEPLFKEKTLAECQEAIQSFGAMMRKALDLLPRDIPEV